MAELGDIWRPANSAHAIQNAFCAVTWGERVPSRLLKTATESVKSNARKSGLINESPITSMTFQAQPGFVTTPTNEEVGIELFSREEGGSLVNRLQITNESVRFDTWRYTRWAAFRSQIEDFIGSLANTIESVVPIQSLAVEYTDFFHATRVGVADVTSLIDINSRDICPNAVEGKSYWHSHAGWLEPRDEASQRLINVDVNSQEAQHPTLGKRHVITIRTLERLERVPGGDISQSLLLPGGILAEADDLHYSLKKRLGSLLRHDAKELISLGSE